MGIQPLSEAELDYGYSQGILQGWFEGNCPKCGVVPPKQLKEHLNVLISGISAYREKYISIQTDYQDLQGRYNDLMAVSAQHLQFMQQQKEQLDAALIEQQRPMHQHDDESSVAK